MSDMQNMLQAWNESGIFVSCLICLIASKGSAFQNLFVFAAAVLSACVAVLKGLPVLHHSADCIFCYFGISDIILGCFEYTVLLKGMLEDVSSAAFIIAAHEQTQ